MRKLILVSALAAGLVPQLAAAQSYGEVRRDQRDVREDRRDLTDAYRYGDRHDIREARRDLRDDRSERRDDWRDYRRAHPDVYRAGGYVGPERGWRYRPIEAGYRFQPAYYGQRYWIDPVRYRLPQPARYQRWVRYGNDVALVDVRSGRVAQVYGGFFY